MDPVLLLYSAQQDAVHIVVVQMMKVMACHCNHFDRYLLGTQVSCMGCTVNFEYSFISWHSGSLPLGCFYEV